MRRHEISDEQWVKIKDSLPGKAGDPGRAAEDNRLFFKAVYWTMARPSRTIRRMELCRPAVQSVVQTGRGGMHSGGLARPGSRMPHARLDDHSRPPACRGGDPKKGVDEALGRSRGGFSTKLRLAVDAEGRLLLSTARATMISRSQCFAARQ